MMPKTRSPYPAAFRQHMLDLVQAGRSPDVLQEGQAGGAAAMPPAGHPGLLADLPRLRQRARTILAWADSARDNLAAEACREYLDHVHES